MTFSKEQMELLKPFEGYFETAVKANWSRNPGRSGLKVIYEVFTKATGDQRRYNDNCNTCILNLLRDCGNIYYLTQYKTDGVEVDPAIIKILAKNFNIEVITKTELDGRRVVRKETRVRNRKPKVS